ncbi:MAG: multidrug transporter ATP-binding protein [Haloplasmataceae bacterium]|nr:multidrug transporter ATP-binding protein [Haloplasmataceae bacterium]
MIEMRHLTKTYDTFKALNDINLILEENKIYGLLGRNGAAKTTLLNLITNKIFPTTGEVLINKQNVYENDKALNEVFYIFEKNLYPEGQKVKDVFKWTKEFYQNFDTNYANSLANKFGLNTKKKMKELSTGYMSIFKDILALASNAKILLLDEPLLGLDANHRDLFYKELIANYIASPKTIIISTHLIDEVEDVIEEVILLKNGKLIVNQSVESFISSTYQVSGEESKVNEWLHDRKFVGLEKIGKYLSATVLENINDKNIKLIDELNLEVSKVELQKLFIHLTN